MKTLPGIGVLIPADWSMGTLANVTAKIGSGATPRGGASVYTESGPALIRSQNVYDHNFKQDGLVFLSDEAAIALRGVTVHSGDVLINITGDSILRTTVVPDRVLPARVNQHVAIVRSNGSVIPGFMQKWLSLPLMKEFMLGHSSGGTRKAITKGHLLSFPIPLPTLAEQRAISAALGKLDEKIESNRRAGATIASLVDAHSVSVSESLPIVRLGDIAATTKVSVNPKTLGSTYVDHYSLPAFDAGAQPERVDASTIKSNKLQVPDHAILLSRLNPRFNRTWWVSTVANIPSLASTEFMVLTSQNLLGLASIWMALRDDYFQRELRNRVTGTSGSHQRVRPEDVLDIEVPDFSQANQTIIETVLALLETAHNLRIQAIRLANLREALLPELLSGRIRVAADEAES